MKIATWNVERLKHESKLNFIISACQHEDADILVLTEADERILLSGYTFCCHTKPPLNHELPPYSMPVKYAHTERYVVIYSKYPCVKLYDTYDDTVAVCAEFKTEQGNLLIYGSVIGIHGHRNPFFNDALFGQMSDLKNFRDEGKLVCFLGDYNCSFSDNYYPSRAAKDTILKCFKETDMNLLTAARVECIDHIAISNEFINNSKLSIIEWNMDKKLSDHKGIAVTMEYQDKV